jgi:5-deoxy-glucuronate isomerase
MADEQGIHASAVPNDLPSSELRISPGPDGTVAADARRAGWRYLSFRSLLLELDRPVGVGRAGHEAVLVMIGGGGVEVAISGGETISLPGRASPFEALPWAVYLPAGCNATVHGRPSEPRGGVRVALAEAPVRTGRGGVAERPVVVSPNEIAVEIRGRGNATRQINHILAPGFPADRLLVVEVYTPAGNWSSWPPHKHDVDDIPTEAVLEEVYYYGLRRPEGWGLQRIYRRDGSRDGLWAVRDGDLVLVTDGYHPFVAAHGYDAYYLNVLAGDRRTMACSFDPDLDWTRAAWERLEVDPRVPLVRPSGWPRSIDRARAGDAAATWAPEGGA